MEAPLPLFQLLTLLVSLPWGPNDTALLHQALFKTMTAEPKVSNQELNYLWNLTQFEHSLEQDQLMITMNRDRVKSIITTDQRQIRFYAYSHNRNPSHGWEILMTDGDSVRFSGMRSDAPIKILIHGFQQNYQSEFPQRMKDAYMESGEGYNVICVDWGPLARSTGPLSSIFYPFVVENVPRVGEKVAELISFLKGQGFISDLNSVHLIGFSLGAHAAGIAGSLLSRKLYRKIGRITGLDPAGPKYTTSQPFARRLDPTDADFVDIVHTNSVKLGYPGQLGHVDFYPNGGKEQPNCDPKGRMKGVQLIYSIQHLFVASCSHSRAPMFFTKSIRSQVEACRCSSWAEFRKSCKTNCRDQIIFGEHVSATARGKYFLDMAI